MTNSIAPNSLLTQYRILAPLGAGGMGEVYLAEDTRLGRKVALKLLPEELTKDPERVRRFIQEAKAASALNHPNIITIYEIGQAGGRDYIATEYIEGETLREKARAERPSLSSALEMASQIASALDAAHEAGIVHRDIKPDNIMVRRDGIIKVLDFGLAKPTDKRTPAEVDNEAATLAKVTTEPGTLMGTAQYMSPEQARGQEVDNRSDLFSLGIVLYEMIAGTVPFAGSSFADTLVSILEKEPPPLSRFSLVPAGVESLMRRCLAKQRELRYQSAKDLLEELKSLAGSLSQTHREAAKPSPSIAVLPFVNMSADPENEYFCDGLAEELLNALAKIESLRVAARTSAFSFKGKEVDVRDIGRKLNVDTVLEGSVRKAGNRLRITAQLINAADGYHLWTERYDRQMEDIFDIQDDISLAIVAVLKVKLLGDEKSAVLKRHTENTEAYRLYLMGRYHYGRWTEDGFRKCIEFFETALVVEPDYALALAGLGLTYGTLSYFGYVAPRECLPRMNETAARALAIDSDLAEGHYTRAMVKFYYEWNWAEAEQSFRRAIELNPSYAEARTQYGLLLAVLGQAGEAKTQAEQALALDPLSLMTNLNVGWVFWASGDNARTEEQGRKMVELEPGFYGGHWLMASAARDRGDVERSISCFETAVSLGASLMVLSQLACLYRVAGDQGKAQQALDQLVELAARSYVAAFHMAVGYAGIGDLNRAFEWLDRAYEEREGTLVYLRALRSQSPELASDPRYGELVRRVGLPES
jgi:eukaryotic-like serine/threonine-protein kinase